METLLERPTLNDQKMAGELVVDFTTKIARRKSDSVKISIQESDESFNVPRKALEFLSRILSYMAEGKAIFLIPSDSEVSTQQAADILGVSRPHVVKMLEQGLIPFKKTGTHRRILLEHLMKYAEEQKEIRSESFKLLAEQAQKLKLGYE